MFDTITCFRISKATSGIKPCSDFCCTVFRAKSYSASFSVDLGYSFVAALIYDITSSFSWSDSCNSSLNNFTVFNFKSIIVYS